MVKPTTDELNYYIRVFETLESFALNEFQIRLDSLKAIADEELIKRKPDLNKLTELELKYYFKICDSGCDKIISLLSAPIWRGLEATKIINNTKNLKKEINSSPNLDRFIEIKDKIINLKSEAVGTTDDRKIQFLWLILGAVIGAIITLLIGAIF